MARAEVARVPGAGSKRDSEGPKHKDPNME